MIVRSPVWGVLPVKPFASAKKRLTAILDATDRARLARAMFEDVLAALIDCRTLEGVVVVTADGDAAAIARQAGALVLDESVALGVNAALLDAIAYLSATNDAGMIMVPSDLPQLSANAIECAIERIDAPAAIALQRASDGGTNLFACRPAGIIPPSFGAGSFDAHCAAARRTGLVPRVIEWPGLEHDLDRPDDLPAFLSLRTPTRSHAFVAQALNRGMMSRAIVSI